MNGIEIQLNNIQDNTTLGDIAHELNKRQKNKDFMRFLKEAPLSKQENIDVLEKELETSHAQLFSIQKHSNNEILGILLFHNFNPQENSLELGFRVNPENQQKGICSSAVEKAIQELFTQGNIDKVEGRHSSFNKGSFGVFRKTGFHLDRFVKEQTFLRNYNHTGTRTDDFKWIIQTKKADITELFNTQKGIIKINTNNREEILTGLITHNFISDKQRPGNE